MRGATSIEKALGLTGIDHYTDLTREMFSLYFFDHSPLGLVDEI